MRVFISYSHDSREHCDQILAFAQQLRRDGIEAELDQFHQDELVHWPRWCEEQLRPENSKYVLCVCTAEYRHRVENRVPADVGKGVFWEASLIYNYLYDEKGNKRCVPILIGSAREDAIPAIFGGWNRYHLRTFRLKDDDPGYEDLYRLLTGKPKVKPEPLGEPKDLLEKSALGAPEQVLPPLLDIPERKTDFMDLIEDIHRKVAHIEQVSIETKADTSEIKAGIYKIVSPIDKLVEIFERRWNEGRQPRHRLVRATTALYSALVSCHEAYARYARTRNPEAFRQWAVALDSLVTSLANMDETLGIFAPELTAALRQYVRSERRLFGSPDPNSLAEFAISELAYVVGDQDSPFAVLSSDFVQTDLEAGLDAPINRLGEFIRTNFTLEEIYGEISSRTGGVGGV